MPKSKPQKTLTRSKFMRILRKAAQPVSEWQHDQGESETPESHHDNDYSETRKNQDKTGDKED